MASVVVVADAGAWKDEMCRVLSDEGFDVHAPTSLDNLCDRSTIDALIVDAESSSAAQLLTPAARRVRIAAPILALSRSGDETGPNLAQALGADQFVPTRATPREVVARVRALLRRFPPSHRPLDEVLEAGHLAVAPARREAIVAGVVVPLVGREVEVLATLVARCGRVVTRAELAVGGLAHEVTDSSIDLVVRRLREKLEAVGQRRVITTVRGVGFRLDPVDDIETRDLEGVG